MDELESVVLSAIKSSEQYGFDYLLDGSFDLFIKEQLASIKQREKRIKVEKIQNEKNRLKKLQEDAKKAAREWRLELKIEKSHKKTLNELKKYHTNLPVDNDRLQFYIDNKDIPLPTKIRRAFVEITQTNKCNLCTNIKSIQAFTTTNKNYPATVCNECNNRDVDPLTKLLNRLCYESAKRMDKKRSEGKEGANHDITTDFLVDLYEEQNAQCKLCGLGMTALIRHKRLRVGERKQWLSGNPTNVSIDQIIPGDGYTMDNVQLVHLRCNLAKRDLDQEEFVMMCKCVAKKYAYTH